MQIVRCWRSASPFLFGLAFFWGLTDPFFAGPLRAQSTTSVEFQHVIQPFLKRHCIQCHSGDQPEAKLDFASIDSEAEIDAAFESWQKAVLLVGDGKMPPEKETRLSDQEKSTFSKWYQSRFIENVEARPGPFQSRRLTAHEYRNTIRSLLGFDLKTNVSLAEETLNETSLVMKLLPTDPRGPSGYRNDSRRNQVTLNAWEAYSQLADSAIDELLSPRQRVRLEAMAGTVPPEGLSMIHVEKFFTNIVPKVLRRSDMRSRERLEQILHRMSSSSDLHAAFRFELKALLMSPGFLYRGLLMPIGKDAIAPVDDFELAERLSYFLWADMPDDELMTLAMQGQLGQSDVLRQQTTRMLQSPKARNLAEDWVVQWLLLDEIDEVSTNVPAVTALKSQPIDFFHYLIQEDRPLLEMIDSKVEFINTYTEGLYAGDRKQLKKYVRPKGIEAEIVPNQRIDLLETKGRGGILVMPGILSMNRGPIIRGTWILERILGDFLPDPPANVGQVPPNKEGQQLSFRQRFEQHRAQATCALCHDKIDPLGFALEAYDARGAFLRAADYKTQAIKKARNKTPQEGSDNLDTSGRLPSGESFEDLDGLKKILMSSQSETVIRNLVSQMLSYALCRKLEYYDQPTVVSITRRMMEAPDHATYQNLIHEIVASLPFRKATIEGDVR